MSVKLARSVGVSERYMKVKISDISNDRSADLNIYMTTESGDCLAPILFLPSIIAILQLKMILVFQAA